MIAVLLLTVTAAAYPIDLSEQELRGKRIYTQGESSTGTPIDAVVSRGAAPIPASILPCAGCHGEDGKGRPEGGVEPPDITWSALSSAQGHAHSYGRVHPAFDEDALGRAITRGVDAGENQLGAAMPRYQMSDADMQDLIAYIRKIEDDLDPGLSDDKIRIGTLLPGTGAAGDQGEMMNQVLSSYFDDINARGGINGRKIELVVGSYEQDSLRAAWEARDFLEKQKVFAMVSGYLSGIERPITALADELRIPLVGPFTPLPQDESSLQRYTFYLTGGLVQQASILAVSRQAGTGEPVAGLAIVHPRGAVYDEVVRAVNRGIDGTEATAFSISYQLPYFDATDFAQTLQKENIRRVLFFGTTRDLQRLATEAADLGWSPELLLPGVYASGGLFEFPASFRGRLFVGYSTLPTDHTPRGVEQFEKLHEDHGLGYQHSKQQILSILTRF